MAYHDLGNIDEALICATLRLGAAEGVQNVTARKLAACCNIATGTIFHRFETMQALLDAAAQAFDRPYMNKAVKLAQANLSMEAVWDNLLDTFLSNPDGTLYYISYTNTFGFDPTNRNPRAKEFLPIARALSNNEIKIPQQMLRDFWPKPLIHTDCCANA